MAAYGMDREGLGLRMRTARGVTLSSTRFRAHYGKQRHLTHRLLYP